MPNALEVETLRKIFGVLARPAHISFTFEGGVNIADTFYITPAPFEAKRIGGSTMIQGWVLQDGDGENMGEVQPRFTPVAIRAMQEWAALSIRHLV